MDGGMRAPGFTSVWKVPRHSPPRSFTAPISVMADDAGEPPVVSRSTTTKVTSRSGVPTSSTVDCTNPDGKRTSVRRQEHVFGSSTVAGYGSVLDADDHTAGNRATYDRIAERYAEHQNPGAEGYESWFADLEARFVAALPVNGLVADAGCGPAFDGGRL